MRLPRDVVRRSSGVGGTQTQGLTARGQAADLVLDRRKGTGCQPVPGEPPRRLADHHAGLAQDAQVMTDG